MGDYIAEYLARLVIIMFMLVFLLSVAVGVVVRYAYRVEGIEDSQCRNGVLYILTNDGDGARTWKATEAKCEI